MWEFDIVAVNGAEVVAVEVKTTLKARQVERFVARMQEFTDLMPRYRGSTVYGAVACLKADEASDSYAERQGLYVIRATGSSAGITNERTSGRGHSARSAHMEPRQKHERIEDQRIWLTSAGLQVVRRTNSVLPP